MKVRAELIGGPEDGRLVVYEYIEGMPYSDWCCYSLAVAYQFTTPMSPPSPSGYKRHYYRALSNNRGQLFYLHSTTA